MHKGQVMLLDGVLALFIAVLLSYSLFAAWPRSTHPTANLLLERAGYDLANAFYKDEIHQIMRRGLEVKGYLSADEISFIQMKLYNYGRLLNLKRIEIEIEGSSSFSVEIDESTPTQKEQFSLILPLKGGAENRIVKVNVWR
ncbi:MAG: hypothetical protein QXF56_01040 [Candidatus Micrarchaeia archaeon]